MRRELGEADGTEETEITVKREKDDGQGRKTGGGRKKTMIDPREISLTR